MLPKFLEDTHVHGMDIDIGSFEEKPYVVRKV